MEIRKLFSCGSMVCGVINLIWFGILLMGIIVLGGFEDTKADTILFLLTVLAGLLKGIFQLLSGIMGVICKVSFRKGFILATVFVCVSDVLWFTTENISIPVLIIAGVDILFLLLFGILWKVGKKM